MTTFDPTNAILLVADDITQLRRCDVYRLLDTHQEHLGLMANYVTSNRPDLEAAVKSCLSDLMTTL